MMHLRSLKLSRDGVTDDSPKKNTQYDYSQLSNCGTVGSTFKSPDYEREFARNGIDDDNNNNNNNNKNSEATTSGTNYGRTDENTFLRGIGPVFKQ